MKFLIRDTLRIFWRHAMRYPMPAFVVVASVLLATGLTTYVPLWYKRFFDILAAGGPDAAANLRQTILVILALYVAGWLCYRAATFTNNFFQLRVMSDLLNTCFAYLHGHSYNFFNSNFSGSLVRRVGRYPRAFEEIADQAYWRIGPTIFRVVIILVILHSRHWLLATIFFGWTVIYILFNYWFARYKLPFDVESAEMDTKIGGHLADSVTNSINLKVFNGLPREYALHTTLTDKLFRVRKFAWNLTSVSEAVQGGLFVALEFAAFYFGISYWQRGILTIGDFALIQTYIIQLVEHLWDMGRDIRRIYERLADAQEMTEILTAPHEVQDMPSARSLAISRGQIIFDHIVFGYHDKKRVFADFSLIVESGERVAFIGPSGGGKTSLIKLLLRFFDLHGGRILIDGQDIAAVTQDSLRHSIALVPQEPILFHRSLYENISYARPEASKKEVVAAAKLAHCHEFISGFPEKYETFVGERGVKLSGGERQRVAIARAILANAPILVLDEATSSLDSESERYIQDALKSLMKGKTTIVIAHRLSTIMQMDRIIVLEHGRISEQGKHTELLKAKQGTYQKLWEIQAGGFATS